jgi:xylulokinase
MERLLDLAASVPPGSRGLRFAPYLAGERTPHADPNVRGAFVGLGLEHGLGDMVRAVLEGVAYGLRDSLELLHGLGLDPASGRISGGGGRSRLWPDIVASVLDLPLDVPATTDAAALGTAILAGVACGAFADVPSGCERCVRIVDRVEPVAAWREAYAEGYSGFRALYPALSEL